MRLEGHVAQMETKRYAYRILGKTDGKRPLVRPKHKWEEDDRINV
jgi:hypothetical protein